MLQIVQCSRRLEVRCLGISVPSSKSRTDQMAENVYEFSKLPQYTLHVLYVASVTHDSNPLEHRVFSEI